MPIPKMKINEIRDTYLGEVPIYTKVGNSKDQSNSKIIF